MRKLISLMVILLSAISGCGIKGNEIVSPEDVINSDVINDVHSNQTSGGIELSHSVKDGIFLMTVDNDLFFLDHELTQYKLSDQVDYFDYEESSNIIKIKKTDGRWVIWFLENKKPELLTAAESIKISQKDHLIYFTEEANQNIYRIDEDDEVEIFDGMVKMFDITEDGQLIIVLDDLGTLNIKDYQGKSLYKKKNVIAYRLDQESQTVMLWADNQVDILKLYEDSISTYKVFEEVTDWLMVPTYSPKFETIARVSTIDFDSGVGDLIIQTQYANQQIDIQNVVNYTLVDEGKSLYYLNNRNELYVLNLVTEETTFLGSGVKYYTIEKNSGNIVFKSEDSLYLVDDAQSIHLVDTDVMQYDYNQNYFAYTNSINDLFVYNKGMITKIAENINSFGLGSHGVYYHQEDKIMYKSFDGQKDIIIDNTSYYKTIYYQNNELYQLKLSLDVLKGYWMLKTDEEVVLYYFDELGRVEVNKWDGTNLVSSMGEFVVMMAGGSMINLQTTYANGQESYITISLMDSNTVQIAENEFMYELDSVSESKALQLINDINELSISK